jgi:GNAT superfamily N-acetyltransferase
MEFALLGWPPDGPTLRLDYEVFAYAGKFVISSTGKAVARDGDVVGAVAFNEDRTDPDCLQLRYVTVRSDRRGEGIGPRLLRFTAERARDRGYSSVQIAANNPFAYEACYRAGFVFTGEETGLAELVLSYRPDANRDPKRYQDGLDRYRERDLSSEEEAFLAEWRGTDPPAVGSDPARSEMGE